MKKAILTIFPIFCIIGMIQECSCSGDENNNGPSTIREAIIANDFEACNRMLENIYYNTVVNGSSYNIAERYIPQAIQVLKAEASYLMDAQNSDAERLFMLCFNDVSGKLGELRYGEKNTHKQDYDNEEYMECVTPLNGCLLSIIREALIKDNLSFAEKVEKLVLVNIKNSSTSEENYIYTFDHSAQKTAKELIRDYKTRNNIN